MKRSVKRIVCAVLAFMMVGSASLEGILHMTAEKAEVVQSNVSTQTRFTNVTGQFDTSAIRAANFNSSVRDTKNVSHATKTVIVSLKSDSLLDAAGGKELPSYMATLSGRREANKIKNDQDEFLATLKQAGIPYSLNTRYNAIDNAVAIEVNTKYLSQIKQMPNVAKTVVANTYQAMQTVETTTDGATTNETNVYATGIYDSSAYADSYSGQGMTVAILDTGLDYTHDAFQNFKSEKGRAQARWDESDIADIFARESLAAERTSTASEVYVSPKVPYAYDYADKDADVYPSYSNHGTHVAGIVGGYDPNGYTDKDGNHITTPFVGVAPDAQLVICKVFTDNLESESIGGAESEDIYAALDDCVKLGVDVINMSLGTTAGFSDPPIGDAEEGYLRAVYTAIQDTGISLICAASNDYSAGYGGAYGTNLTTNPDSATIGSPASYSSALAVASISGQKSKYIMAGDDQVDATPVFYEESSDENSNPYDFAKELLPTGQTTGSYEYIVIPGVGQTADYSSIKKNVPGRIALVERGDTTFLDKVETASKMGAIAIIVYNNVAGKIRMSLGEIQEKYRIPAISITMESGEAMVDAAGKDLIGSLHIDTVNYLAGPFMSDFSSWGPTPDLKLKPEITAHGGEITSTVPGGYDEQSGTSMAAPNMAGFTAIVRSYVEKEMDNEVKAMMAKYDIKRPVAVNRLVNQLTMSTATIAEDEIGLPYSPRQQGAGLASLDNILSSSGSQAYLYTNNEANDYRPKVELGDDPLKAGEYTVEFSVKNFGTSVLTFGTESVFMTEKRSIDGLAVAEQAHILDDVSPVWYVRYEGETNYQLVTANTLNVQPGKFADVQVVFKLSTAEAAYIDDNFANGMFVEGFVKLTSKTQCDLTIPFMGFYGDWTKAPMLDYSAFEIAEFEQDTSIADELKPQASVFETQPFSAYYNDDYVLPMGSFVYLLPDDVEPVYANEEYCAVSRYNEYISTDGVGNYMTSTSIRAVYAGLLRNARKVEYRLFDAYTGELILEDVIDYVGKAYSGGGSARPANVELKLAPDEFGLAANGKYKMEFDFFLDYGEETDEVPEGNKFEFSFYVDYDAPVLENAGIRYETKSIGNKEQNFVYLDLEIYDNHYPQSVMLCYGDTNEKDEEILVLATDYILPVRNPVKNGTSKISIDITDIYAEYKNNLYIQLDDYALNNCVYFLEELEGQSDNLPDSFTLADGEANLTLAINEAHKVALNYQGNASAANFVWESRTPDVVAVREGEIVGLKPGKGSVTVTNGKGVTRRIAVTVTEEVKDIRLNGISFGLIRTYTESLAKAEGTVTVNAGEEIQLQVLPDPWYYPIDDLPIEWYTQNAKVVELLDQNGRIRTLTEGKALIKASITGTAFSASVVLDVEDEFTVANFTLSAYHGIGWNETITRKNEHNQEEKVNVLRIPNDMNIMYIGDEAFMNNHDIEILIIPKTVVQINERAFANCTSLREIYFDEMEAQPIANSKLSLVYNEAFYGCTNLEKVDLSNTKTFTIGAYCFASCTSLKEVIDMTNIGTMHNYAFAGCVSLQEAELNGLHMSGRNVFDGCISLANIQTGKFTALGVNMFSGCNLLEEVVIRTPKVGESAFAGCKGLKTITFYSEDEELLFDIGANAFANCGKLSSVDFGNATIRSIGDGAFANTGLTTFAIPNGLTSLGGNILKGSQVTSVSFPASFDFENLSFSGLAFGDLSIDLLNAADGYLLRDGVLYNADATKLYMVTKNAGMGEFNIPDTVQEILAYAFVGSKFTRINVPASVTKIGVSAFMQSQATEIVFDEHTMITALPEKVFANSALRSFAVPASVQTLGNGAFSGSAIISITFATDAQLTTLGDSVFSDCRMLTAIQLPENVVSIGDNTFRNCLLLKYVVMPALEQLGAYTFVGANNLKEVTFDENAKTAGSFTFMGTPVEKVTLGNLTTLIADGQRMFVEGYIGYVDYESVGGMFYNCGKLREVVMENVVYVGSHAFENCVQLNTDLSQLQTIAERAFYNCNSLSTLTISQATSIGKQAFAIGNGGNSAGGTLTINAKTIGEQAFYGLSITSVDVGTMVENIGYGAFANAKKLNSITVSKDNKVFFAEANVLYRNFLMSRNDVDGMAVYSTDSYELVAYPAALQAENSVYTVKEGTLSVEAYAFNGLITGAVKKIILPYSVTKIGDSAFYQSAIQEYVFNSMRAPILETAFRKNVANHVDANDGIYKGMYYRNFEKLLADYLDLTSYIQNDVYLSTSNLSISYPINAKGYDNYVYINYFGKKTTTDVAMEDYTREAQAKLLALPSVDEIATWTPTSATKEFVEEQAGKVAEARIYLNNIKDEQQREFFGLDNVAKLAAIEKAMREAKARFNIEVAIFDIEATGNYKKTYLEGETFVTDGLSFIITYEDGSTEEALFSDFTLLTTRALTKYDRYVEVRYTKTMDKYRVSVTVTTPPVEEPNPPEQPSEPELPETPDNLTPQKGGNGWIIAVVVGGIAVLGGAVAVFFVLNKKGYFSKKNKEKTAETITDTQENKGEDNNA